MPRRWWRLSAVWMDYRWRWNWWRPAPGPCRRPPLRRGSTAACRCSRAGLKTCRTGSAPSAIRSPGATTCCEPNEQTLFRRLGVFAGGCTLEAAEAVANLDAPFDVLEGMVALLDASLVQSEEQDAESRYTMLATVREFAQERLREIGEESATRDRHARFFRDLAERAGPYHRDRRLRPCST